MLLTVNETLCVSPVAVQTTWAYNCKYLLVSVSTLKVLVSSVSSYLDSICICCTLFVGTVYFPVFPASYCALLGSNLTFLTTKLENPVRFHIKKEMFI